MAIKIYISGNSGNKEIVTHQQRIFMILKSLGIEFEPVDITAPGMEDERDFMRKNGKKKNGQRNVLPPQIFNDDNYCGDYDDFDLANEDDELEEFLGIPRITPKSNPVFKKGDASSGPPDSNEGKSVNERVAEDMEAEDHHEQEKMEQDGVEKAQQVIPDDATEPLETAVEDATENEEQDKEKIKAEEKLAEVDESPAKTDDDAMGEEEEEYEYEDDEEEGEKNEE